MMRRLMHNENTITIPSSLAADFEAWGRLTARLFGELKKLQDRPDTQRVTFRIPDLIPPKVIPKDQAWFWSDHWQAGERQVNEDIKAGRMSGPFASVDEFLTDLHLHSHL